VNEFHWEEEFVQVGMWMVWSRYYFKKM